MSKKGVDVAKDNAMFIVLSNQLDLLMKFDWERLSADNELYAKFKHYQEAIMAMGYHAADKKKPKQVTALLKCECMSCGYTIRVTAKWLQAGVPVCPNKDCAEKGAPMVHEETATTADERVNTYHTRQKNSLAVITKEETGIALRRRQYAPGELGGFDSGETVRESLGIVPRDEKKYTPTEAEAGESLEDQFNREIAEEKKERGNAEAFAVLEHIENERRYNTPVERNETKPAKKGKKHGKR